MKRARREVSIREKILTSQLLRVIGRQLASEERSRPGFGIREIRVLDQEGGGEAPKRIELKRGRRIGIRSSAKV
jgi:hypothetical protein